MVFLFWPLFGALIGVAAAQRRGFSVVAGVLGGLLLGPLAFLMFFVTGVVSRAEERRKCPFCAEWISGEAIVCRYCQRDLPRPAQGPQMSDAERQVRALTAANQQRVDSLLKRGLAFSILWLTGLGSAIAIISGEKARRLIRGSDGALVGMGRVWWCFIVGAVGLIIGGAFLVVGILNNLKSP